jgi:hypothetical protein
MHDRINTEVVRKTVLHQDLSSAHMERGMMEKLRALYARGVHATRIFDRTAHAFRILPEFLRRQIIDEKAA